MSNSRMIFIHIHIPKCGGSTVFNYLKYNFKKNLLRTTGVLNDYTYSNYQVSQIIDQNPQAICLSGHKLSLDLPFEDKNKKIVALTWIRNPVDRFISHYFYHRNHTNIVPQAKELDFLQYVNWALVEKNNEKYIDGQLRYLGINSLEHIQQLISRNNLILYPMESMQESIYALSLKFPDYFKYINLSVRNKSTKDSLVDEQSKCLVSTYMQNDMELYELAKNADLNSIPKPLRVSLQQCLVYKLCNFISSMLHHNAHSVEYFKNIVSNKL